MDTEYINGVVDTDGVRVMRPMTDDEKAWLAQFYKEWLNADGRDPKLYTKDEDWKRIYGENNSRNRCLYNYAKKMGILKTFSAKKGDKKFVKELGDLDLELMLIDEFYEGLEK